MSEKTFVRRKTWRQATPRDQLVAVLGAARGIASNLAEGMYPLEIDVRQKSLELDDLLEQCVELTTMVDGVWPQPTQENGG